MKKSTLFFLFTLFVTISVVAQPKTETELITDTINNYIQGTSYGNQDQVRKAFHPDLNLYSIRNGKLNVWFGLDYINGITEGRNTGRTGKILAIDYENDVATAKAEIIIPGRPAPFIDYFILAKAEGKWTIIHKAYTVKTSR
ncbi:MAG: nuclear transport factor 2 family protein [Balneolaceae bacterium]